jgi:general secretion pathway protein A
MPDVIDLRDQGPRPIEDFAGEPAEAGSPDAPALVSASTLTYERYYGLREKPFSLSTDPRFLFRSTAHAPVLRDLTAAIRRREGLIVLTGDIGTGKTTLCRAMLGQLDRRTFATFVPDPFVTREDLLKTMLIDFGVMSVEDLVKGRLKGASRPDLSYPLYEFLRSLEPLDAFAVLVIDEVQNLSLPLLEEIRILSDLEAGRKLLQVVLVGQPEFDEHLRLPRMRQIRQRVSVHCELQPLDRDGLSGYVAHRLHEAGPASSQLRVAEDALDLLFTATSGVPRAVNLVCDKALAHGERAGTFLIDAALVQAAIADLRLALPPAPVNAPAVSPVPLAQAPPAPAPEAVKPASVPAPAVVAARSPAAPSTLDALLDLPAVDLRPKPGDVAERPSRRPPPARLTVARGKVWHGPPRLGAVAATVLVLLGATTGVSLVGYWMWLRPLLAEPIALPSVQAPVPTMAVTVRPESVVAPAPATETWAIQTGVFTTRTRAAVLVARLVELGYPAFQRDIEFAGQGAMPVALAGPFPSEQEAEAARARLRAVPGFQDAMTRRLPPP